MKTKLDFKDGQVNVKPFNLQYEDIAIVVDGSHGFDKTMNYKAVFDVPAKYLGTEVNNLMAKIDDEVVKDITIPVTATIGGSLKSPNVSTDLTSGIANLTKQLIEIQKEKLINQGKDEIKDILEDVLGGNTNETDSTQSQTKDPVKEVLDDIIDGKQTHTDTTSTNSKNTIKDVLGSILRDNNKKKDTVN